MSSRTSIARRSAAVLACAFAMAAPAHALDIEVGSYVRTGIGAEFETPYDTFQLLGNTLSVSPSPAPVAVSLGTLSFEVGPNCYSCAQHVSADALVDLTVDGVHGQLDLPYAWSSSGPNDFLTFSTPTPVVFDLGALGLVKIEIQAPPQLWSPGGTVYAQLGATVATTPVPEPASFALLLGGLGLIGFVARRRR
jgi:hypothetical protein